jgi:putative membrane protein
MVLANQFGRGFDHHRGWWALFGLLPFLLLLILAGLVLWMVVRGGERRSSVASVDPAPPQDHALEEVRLRYARGEIGREEFLQRSHDLGAPDATGSTPTPTPTPPS